MKKLNAAFMTTIASAAIAASPSVSSATQDTDAFELKKHGLEQPTPARQAEATRRFNAMQLTLAPSTRMLVARDGSILQVFGCDYILPSNAYHRENPSSLLNLQAHAMAFMLTRPEIPTNETIAAARDYAVRMQETCKL